jgi:hypothetical protein
MHCNKKENRVKTWSERYKSGLHEQSLRLDAKKVAQIK